MMLFPMFLALLMMQAVIPVTSTLLSVQVVSYKRLRNVKDGPVKCALDTANKTISSSSLEECSLSCVRDSTCIGFNIKNLRVSPVSTWFHLCWLQHQELASHLWARDDTCAGFNIKNSSLTCEHVMTPVLASTSRTRVSPVSTWWHLYWLQRQELESHLWARNDTCAGFNIKNLRVSPVITWWHLC